MSSPVVSGRPPPVRNLVRTIAWWLAVAVGIGVHLASARWHVLYGAHNTDEGFYAIATRAVAHGEMPYRDFGFTQPPLVLYANALPLRLLGFGMFPQRALNGAWAALALVLGAVWLGRRTRPAWGLGLALIFSLSAPWMYFVHMGKTYGITILLGMLATWVFLALAAGPRRNFTLGLLAALGVGSRLPAAPFFGLLWLLALWPGRRPTLREVLAAAGGAALCVAVAILPFCLSAPEAVWFWTIDFHRISVPNKPWNVSWREIVVLAPAVWLLGVLALGFAASRCRWFVREAGVLLAAGTALACNLLPNGVYEEYGVPFLLPFAAAAAALVYDGIKTWKVVPAILLVTALVAVQAVAPPMLLATTRPERRGTLSQWLPPRVPPYNRALPVELAAARRVVETSLAPTAPFIGSNIILAAETGREVPAVLRMGPFSWTGEMSPDRAARLHLATRDQLDAWFAQPEVTVLSFFQRWDLNYGWSMPSFHHEPPKVREETLDRLERDFRLAYNNGDFFLLERRKVRWFPVPLFDEPK